MSKIQEAIPALTTTAKKINKAVTTEVMESVCNYLGPSLFSRDSSLIAYRDKTELVRIRESFVKKKLGIQKDDSAIDSVILKIGDLYGMSVRNKKRAVVYALLMVHYDIISLK